MKILLPNNVFGQSVMLALIVLLIVVSLATVYWAVSLVAPWWVALPTSLLAALVTFILTVKFK